MHLKEIREKLNWSFGEMAQALGIAKATYQSYDNQTRATPPDVLDMAEKTLEISLRHSADLKRRYLPGGEADQYFAKKYPHGIISELSGFE